MQLYRFRVPLSEFPSQHRHKFDLRTPTSRRTNFTYPPIESPSQFSYRLLKSFASKDKSRNGVAVFINSNVLLLKPQSPDRYPRINHCVQIISNKFRGAATLIKSYNLIVGHNLTLTILWRLPALEILWFKRFHKATALLSA
jgi:hypothetical protein